jgi:hypothetical protein
MSISISADSMDRRGIRRIKSAVVGMISVAEQFVIIDTSVAATAKSFVVVKPGRLVSISSSEASYAHHSSPGDAFLKPLDVSLIL